MPLSRQNDVKELIDLCGFEIPSEPESGLMTWLNKVLFAILDCIPKNRAFCSYMCIAVLHRLCRA